MPANPPQYRTSPAAGLSAAITPGSSDLSPQPRSLFISVAGNITITNQDGSSSGSVAVPIGVLPIAAKKVTAATATVHLLYD
jgi:hypothetical protein